MTIQTSDIVRALIAYAGPFDDPRIGWIGRDSSRPDLFRCERCGAEHEDCQKIEHKPGCSAADLLAVMQALASNAKCNENNCPYQGQKRPSTCDCFRA